MTARATSYVSVAPATTAHDLRARTGGARVPAARRPVTSAPTRRQNCWISDGSAACQWGRRLVSGCLRLVRGGGGALLWGVCGFWGGGGGLGGGGVGGGGGLCGVG